MTHYLLIKNQQQRRFDIYYNQQLIYYIIGSIGRYGEKCFLQTPNHDIIAQLINQEPQFIIVKNNKQWRCRRQSRYLYTMDSLLAFGKHRPFAFHGVQLFHSVFDLYHPDDSQLNTYYFDINTSSNDEAILLLFAHLLCQQVPVGQRNNNNTLIKQSSLLATFKSLFVNDRNDENLD